MRHHQYAGQTVTGHCCRRGWQQEEAEEELEEAEENLEEAEKEAEEIQEDLEDKVNQVLNFDENLAKKKKTNLTCAIDPGSNSFLTTYSPCGDIYKLGTNNKKSAKSDVVKKVIELCKSRGWFLEASLKMEEIMKTSGAPVVQDEEKIQANKELIARVEELESKLKK